MKMLTIILSSLLCSNLFSQDLLIFKDTINHYSIGIPKGWQYGFSKNPKADILFQAIRPKQGNELFTENYNINQVPFPNSNIDSAYKNMLETISQNKGYEFVNQGDTIIGNKKYKWLIEDRKSVV